MPFSWPLALDITFLNPISFPVLLMASAAIAGFLIFAFYRFSILSRRHIRIILGILRALLIALVFFMILDPYWNRPGDADWMGVLIDTSQSMNVSETGTPEKSRIGTLKNYFENDTYWKGLQKNRIKKYVTFDTKTQEFPLLPKLKAKGKVSKLTGAVQEIENRYREDVNLMGWILFSDGAATDVPAEQKTLMPDAAIPWITVGMGLDEEVPNVRLHHPILKEPVFVGDVLQLNLEWESNLPEKASALLLIQLDNKPLIEKEILLKDKKFNLEFMIRESGNHFLDILLDPSAEEGSDMDNFVRVGLRAHPRETHVFYAESFYKEKNFFKEALEEDQSFKVSFASSLVGFSRKQKVPFIKDPIYGFPVSRRELFHYDVIVLSDVKRSLLSNEQMEWIRELVNEDGGALVMVGGVDSFGDGGYVGTPIEKMLPVEISEEYKQKNFLKARGVNENPFRPALSTAAEKHPVMQLGSTPEQSKILWEGMPLLGGYNYVGRVKPAAVSLLEHPAEKSTFGARAILAVQSFGQGKVLAFTSDVTPNWGQWFQEWKKGEEWLYAKFWRNALKWLTENRVRGRASAISIERQPLLAESMKPVTFQITLPERDPLQGNTELKLEIIKGRDLLLSEIFKDPETEKVSWKIPHLEPGDYGIKALYSIQGELPIIAEAPFAVHPSRMESQFLRTNHGLLKQLAGETQGMFLAFNQLEDLDKGLGVLRKAHLRQRSAPFWNHPAFYAGFLLILFVDWFIRKKQGLE